MRVMARYFFIACNPPGNREDPLFYSTFRIVEPAEKNETCPGVLSGLLHGMECGVWVKSADGRKAPDSLRYPAFHKLNLAFKESEVGNDELSSPGRRRMAGG